MFGWTRRRRRAVSRAYLNECTDDLYTMCMPLIRWPCSRCPAQPKSPENKQALRHTAPPIRQGTSATFPTENMMTAPHVFPRRTLHVDQQTVLNVSYARRTGPVHTTPIEIGGVGVRIRRSAPVCLDGHRLLHHKGQATTCVDMFSAVLSDAAWRAASRGI